MTDEAAKARASRTLEVRIRRSAERQGLQLHRSRRRDPRALDYGKYWLIDPTTRESIFGGTYGKTLEEVESWLEPSPPRAKPDLSHAFFNHDEQDVLAAIDLFEVCAQATDDDLIAEAARRVGLAWQVKLAQDEEERIEAMTDEEFRKYLEEDG
jgi:hypothetical protein